MLLFNARIAKFDSDNTLIENGAILVKDGVIADIGPSMELTTRYPEEPAEDMENRWIMPGNICGHTHFYGAFARGLATAGSPATCFTEILEKLWWQLDKALSPEAVKASAEVCLIDAIRHGTTTLIDHHASPACVDGSLDIIADAVHRSGLRASLCYEVTDRNGSVEASAGIKENMRFINKLKKQPSSMIAATFGMHASLTLSDKTLEMCSREINGESGIHIHVAEAEVDENDSLEKYGMRVVERLHHHGLLNDQSILAHCVHIDEKERELILESNSFVTHQPRSNMNNAVGASRVEWMLDAGVPVALGNDGFSNNMWAEWKAAYLIHKHVNQDPRSCQGYAVMDMASKNNRKLISKFWPDQTIGELETGACADLILIDYHPFTPVTSGNLPWHILFGFEADCVHSTMVSGKWLMKNRVILHLDEQEIAHNAYQASVETWKKLT